MKTKQLKQNILDQWESAVLHKLRQKISLRTSS